MYTKKFGTDAAPFFGEEEKMVKSFRDVVQDSPRSGLGISVNTKYPPFKPIHRP